MSNEGFAEFGIIASIIEHPNILPVVREELDLSDFLREKNRVVYRAICELYDTGITPGWDSLLEHLTASGDLPKVGGASGLAEMIDGVPRSDDVRPLIRMVKKLALDHRAASEFEVVRLALEDGEQPSEVLAEQLPKLAELHEQATAGRRPRFELLHWSELDQLPEPKFLPGTHIFSGGFNMWYGLSGTGKSFKALTDGYHLSRLGLGAVVYVSPEGKGAWAKRRKAWSEHSGLAPDEMYFHPGAVNLLNDGEVSDFIADLKTKFPDGVLLVVFDTKSRMMPGANENDAKDDGLQVTHTDRIKDMLGSAILLIHHSDKKDLSARGSGATTNAADCILKLKRSAEIITISVTWPEGKLKDGEPWPDEQFRFVKAADSVVLEPTDKVTTEFSTLTPKHIAILKAIGANGAAGAGYKRIAALTGIPERSVYRYVEDLIAVRPMLVSGFELPKNRGKRLLITPAGRKLLPIVPNPRATDKPNGHSKLVDPLASSPTVRQRFASDLPPFAATLPSKGSGEVANSVEPDSSGDPEKGTVEV